MKKTTIKITTLLLLTVAIIISCKQIIDSKEEKLTIQEKIQNDKLEATLLVKATQHNLNTIALCNAVEELEENQEVKNIANTIKEEQQRLFEKLQNLANENMVSVASEPTYQPSVLEYFKNEDIATLDMLDDIKNKLETQIEVLDTLRMKTDNDEIEIAAQEYIEILKDNKEITENTLESLE